MPKRAVDAAKKAASGERSIATTTCPVCKAKKGERHREQCINSSCAECESVIGHKLTCSSHPHYKKPVLDGKTGAVIDGEVDGKPAKIDTTPRKKKANKAADVDADSEDGEGEDEDDGIKRLAPPKISDPDAIEALQYALNEKIIFGIKQPQTKTTPCEAEWFDAPSDQSVGCTGAAAFDYEDPKTCPTCQATKKKPRDKFCVAHMAMHVVGKYKDRQTDLFTDPE